MNNKTEIEIKIKLKGDGVYDIYVNKEWAVSRGSLDNVIMEVRRILEEHENAK